MTREIERQKYEALRAAFALAENENAAMLAAARYSKAYQERHMSYGRWFASGVVFIMGLALRYPSPGSFPFLEGVFDDIATGLHPAGHDDDAPCHDCHVDRAVPARKPKIETSQPARKRSVNKCVTTSVKKSRKTTTSGPSPSLC